MKEEERGDEEEREKGAGEAIKRRVYKMRVGEKLQCTAWCKVGENWGGWGRGGS